MKIIKDLREAANVTQAQVAEKLGVNVQFISNIERGASPLPAHQFKPLAKALRCRKEDLIIAAVAEYELRLRRLAR